MVMLERGYRGGHHSQFQSVTHSPRAMFRWVAIVLSLAGAIGCMTFGVYTFVRGTHNERHARVGAYNAAVKVWRSQRVKLEPLQVKIQVGNLTHLLLPNVQAEKIVDDVTEDLLTYQPLKLAQTGPLFPTVNWDAAVGSNHRDVQLHLNDNGVLSELSVGKVVFYNTIVYKRTNPKNCLYQLQAYWNPNVSQCQIYQRSTELCVAISPTAEYGHWQLRPKSQGGSGCFLGESEASLVRQTNVPGSSQGYGDTPPSSDGSWGGFASGQPPVGPVDFSDFTATVRVSADPWLEAERVTQGSFEFGPTQRDDYMQGATFVALGVLLAMPSVSLCVVTWQDPEDGYERVPGATTMSGQDASWSARCGRFWSRIKQQVSASPKVQQDFDGL